MGNKEWNFDYLKLEFFEAIYKLVFLGYSVLFLDEGVKEF